MGELPNDDAAMMRSLIMSTPLPSARTQVAFDPRYGQIAAQTLLLSLTLFWLDFGPTPAQVCVYLGGTQAIELLRARLARDAVNWKSALSTGLSLSLLLRTHEVALWFLACLIAMGSKYLLRVNGKHLFNPSAFAIVAMLLLSREVWVSPGQWGTTLWLLALGVSMSGLILTRVARVDIALAFFAAHAGLLLLRALWLGDPLTIPLHQLQSGSVLIFALFMLTDPRSTPDRRIARVVFGAAVAVLTHALLFRWQVREAVFYSLILVSCLTPLLDRIWPGPRFVWPEQSGV
jgi:enediyne biosynthesis protein E5